MYKELTQFNSQKKNHNPIKCMYFCVLYMIHLCVYVYNLFMNKSPYNGPFVCVCILEYDLKSWGHWPS